MAKAKKEVYGNESISQLKGADLFVFAVERVVNFGIV